VGSWETSTARGKRNEKYGGTVRGRKRIHKLRAEKKKKGKTIGLERKVGSLVGGGSGWNGPQIWNADPRRRQDVGACI